MDEFKGTAIMKDGTVESISGSLPECAKWADEMRKNDFAKIEIKAVQYDLQELRKQ